jgi:hypothetical protein
MLTESQSLIGRPEAGWERSRTIVHFCAITGAIFMHEYEYRIMAPAVAALVIGEIQLTDRAAIISARKMADGRAFEVWRGDVCIYDAALGNATLPKARARQPNR